MVNRESNHPVEPRRETRLAHRGRSEEETMMTYLDMNQLWAAVIEANRNHHNLEEISFEIGRLGDRLQEHNDLNFDAPLSSELVSLLTRATSLFDDFTQHQGEIDDLFQNAAWAFSTAKWDLRRGDRIEYTNWKKVKQVLYADVLHLRECDAGDLILQGRIIKKDDSPGKKHDHIQLIHQEWTNLSKQERQNSEPSGPANLASLGG